MSSTLEEYGFWDYTAPRAGGMEAFQRDDYLLLLDDMAGAGMNSLLIVVKWLTTGYRSCLPFLDQLPGNAVIESDNALLRETIEEAGKRGIKIWLGAVVSIFEQDAYGLEPHSTQALRVADEPPLRIGDYDADSPEFTERAVQICEELVELFSGVGGLMVELENCGIETPRRIPLYNRWAEENERPPFDGLGHPFDPRLFDVSHWRDYTTHVRLDVMQAIEQAVRAKGFGGDLSTILETANATFTASQEINLEDFRTRCGDWTSITYEYAKWRHRYAMMDFCIDQPKRAGLKVYYLPRGVMTWAGSWPLPLSLEESWGYDIEDVQQFQPDGLWWFGCGAVNEGTHVSPSRLQVSGFESGVAARRALLKQAEALRAR